VCNQHNHDKEQGTRLRGEPSGEKKTNPENKRYKWITGITCKGELNGLRRHILRKKKKRGFKGGAAGEKRGDAKMGVKGRQVAARS